MFERGETDQPCRTWRWRFRLSTLFFITGGIAVVLGTVANDVQVAHRHYAAAVEVEARGGLVSFRSPAPTGVYRACLHALFGEKLFAEVFTINLRPRRESDLDLLRSFPELTGLDLMGPNVTDTGLQRLVGLKRLRVLSIDDAPAVTDAGMPALGELEQLEMLKLTGTQVSDEGLSHLRRLNRLTVLLIVGGHVQGKALAKLTCRDSLRDLALTDTGITDEGLTSLREFHSLRYLNLAGAQITDAGLAQLTELPSLDFLDLSRTRITDAGAPAVSQLRVREVDLSRTQMTAEGFINLDRMGSLRRVRVLQHMWAAVDDGSGMSAFFARQPGERQ